MRAAIIILAAAAITACGRDQAENVAEGPAGKGEAANLADEARPQGAKLQFRPGKWAATIRVEQVDAPGMPPQMADGLKQMFSSLEPIQSCLSAKDANRPAADFFLGRKRADCRYERFSMESGVLDARLRCERDGVGQTMTIQGSYSPETYQLAATSRLQEEARPEQGAMSLRLNIAARRTGACDGSEKADF